MLLKKPYAFLIKYFKIINFILTILCVYLLFCSNSILRFLNNYLIDGNSVIGMSLKSNLFNLLFFIFPILIIIISCFLLWLMVKKKKPFKFYLINVFVYLIFFFVIIYSYSFIGKMETDVIDILVVRVLRDIFIILVFIQGIISIFLLFRSLGFDIKKFDFMSDLNKMDLSDDDKDEIEIEFNVDSNERKRRLNKKISDIKYSLKENKSFVIFIFILIFVLILFFGYKKYNMYFKYYDEGTVISSDFYDFKVNNSYLINTSYRGDIITDNYLVVLNISIKRNNYQTKLIKSNFKLKVNNKYYDITNNYDKYLSDLGSGYTNEDIISDYSNYLLIYEIPLNEIDNKMRLIYSNIDGDIKINLKPTKFIYQEKDFNIGDIIKIDDDEIVINNYEIKDYYALNYDYCIKDNCYNSIQYLYPSLDTNYDKVIIKINGIFKNGVNSNYNNFSNFVSSVGIIQYNFNGEVKYSKINRISNIKKEEKDIYYYEINKEVLNSDSLKIVFNTRKCKYSYILK